MATVSIESSINAGGWSTGSKNVRPGDVISLRAAGAHATYTWELVYKPLLPDGSSSTATAATPNAATSSVTIDNPTVNTANWATFGGGYLVKLYVTDNDGSSAAQYVRFRVPTIFGDLNLPAAGERNDAAGIIPYDVGSTGWADNENENLRQLLWYVGRQAISGRVLFVDANRGTDYTTAQNTSAAEGYADYSSINSAITAAVNDASPPSADYPYTIAIRPGLYVEDVVLKPYIHLIGMPGTSYAEESDKQIIIRTTGATAHTNVAAGAGQYMLCRGLHFENTTSSTLGVLEKSGASTLYLVDCTFTQKGTNVAQEAPLELDAGRVAANRCVFTQMGTGDHLRVAYRQAGGSTVGEFRNCSFFGPSIVDLNVAATPYNTTIVATFQYCEFLGTSANAAAFGVRTNAEITTLDYCNVTVDAAAVANALAAHPQGDAHAPANGITLNCRYTSANGVLSADTTNVVGAVTCNLAAVVYTALTLTEPVSSVVVVAKAQAKTIFYDNSGSALVASDAQAAIDELDAANAALLPGASTDNALVRWNGVAGTAVQDSSWIVADSGSATATVTDGNGNTILRGLTLRRDTSAGAATGLGTGIGFNLEDDGGDTDLAGTLDVLASAVTVGSERAEMRAGLLDTGWATTLTGVLRIESTGRIGVGRPRGATGPEAPLEVTGTLDDVLTGTLTPTNGSAALVGVGTVFLTELAEGDALRIHDSGDSDSTIYTVQSIADDLNLTLDSNYSGTGGATVGTGYRDYSDLVRALNGDAVVKVTISKDGYGSFRGGVNAAGPLDFDGHVKGNRTVHAITGNILDTEYIVACSANNITLTLPTPIDGLMFIIKDESGSAGTLSITVAGGGPNIDGIATLPISSDYGVARVYSDGTNWFTW